MELRTMCCKMPPQVQPHGGRRHDIHVGDKGEGHDDDLNLVVGSLCGNVRYRRRQDVRSCRGIGGDSSPTFDIGKVGRPPLHCVVGPMAETEHCVLY